MTVSAVKKKKKGFSFQTSVILLSHFYSTEDRIDLNSWMDLKDSVFLEYGITEFFFDFSSSQIRKLNCCRRMEQFSSIFSLITRKTPSLKIHFSPIGPIPLSREEY